MKSICDKIHMEITKFEIDEGENTGGMFKMERIGIIGAMEIEVAALKEKLSGK